VSVHRQVRALFLRVAEDDGATVGTTVPTAHSQQRATSPACPTALRHSDRLNSHLDDVADRLASEVEGALRARGRTTTAERQRARIARHTDASPTSSM
jgi:hypothetical protein